MASAPEASRAWLLIEHPGPWPHEPSEALLPAPLHALVTSAVEFGIRVQMIRRPGRRPMGDVRSVFAGWTAGSEPWLRRGEISWAELDLAERGMGGRGLERLAAGNAPGFGSLVSEPVYLVCTHGRRNVCCARFGGPLAQALVARQPGRVWETTHVGGHRYAANLVILPHGLYYGPVDVDAASAAIGGYEQGLVMPERYRGRAGQPKATQEAEYALLTQAGSLKVDALALPPVRGLRLEGETGESAGYDLRVNGGKERVRTASAGPSAGGSLGPGRRRLRRYLPRPAVGAPGHRAGRRSPPRPPAPRR
jgi:hypothetical protein